MHPMKPSPFYKSVSSLGMDGKFNLNFTGKVIGKASDQLVIKSNIEIDPGASLVCVPEDRKYAPILVKHGSNMPDDPDVINLFPIGKVSGKGREWIPEVPEYKTKIKNSRKKNGLILRSE